MRRRKTLERDTTLIVATEVCKNAQGLPRVTNGNKLVLIPVSALIINNRRRVAKGLNDRLHRIRLQRRPKVIGRMKRDDAYTHFNSSFLLINVGLLLMRRDTFIPLPIPKTQACSTWTSSKRHMPLSTH